jgi:putative membrane protein
MSSDHRLHPASIIFNLGAQAKELLVPGLIVLLGARSSDDSRWQIWAMFLLVPYCFIAIGRYISYRYRYETNELVIRSGLIFRNERHIPYGRIQNLDAIQNLFHRWLGVVTVRLETGGGSEAEATMSVLPTAALEEMRQRVFEGRGRVAAEPAETGASEDVQPVTARPDVAPAEVLALSPRELMIAGLIENRGMVLVAALFGVIWEAGLLEGVFDRLLGENTTAAPFRRVFRSIFGAGAFPWREAGLMFVAFTAMLVAIRLFSMVWGLTRLYGFRLTRTGEDLRSEYGLFTRVVATVPMRRIQTLTVFEGPWHQLFGWAAVRVTTAGGHGGGEAAAQREWLAPIIDRGRVLAFLREVLPEAAVEPIAWQGVHPRAIIRALRVSAILPAIVAAVLVMILGWWDLVLFAVLLTWAAVAARQYVRHLGWMLTDTAVFFRSGWWWRYHTVARFTRIQAVSMSETPFDRRTGMASVRVDTAGADAAHSVDIPYLDRDVAQQLYSRLADEAEQTQFRW